MNVWTLVAWGPFALGVLTDAIAFGMSLGFDDDGWCVQIYIGPIGLFIGNWKETGE